MNQTLKIIIIAITLSIAHLMLAGAMAWGYVDESSKTGIWYHYLYSLPYGLSLYLKLSGSVAVTLGIVIVFSWYAGFLLLCKSAIRRVK